MKDTPHGDGPSRRLLAALGIVMVAVVAFLLGRATSRETVPLRPEGETAPENGPGPTQELNGVPVGYARTEEGAIVAATEFARVMTAASGERAEYVTALETLAAPEWRVEAAELAANGFDFFLNRYGSEGTATFAPVRYRVADFSPDRATVDLWGVLTVSSPSSDLEESWMTGTLTLVWTKGDWRVAGQSSHAGPTPRLFQENEGPASKSLDGFEDYERAPAP